MVLRQCGVKGGGGGLALLTWRTELIDLGIWPP